MLELRLNGQETDQLYVILRMFSDCMPMNETMFKKDGPARELARRIADHILPMGEISITK